MSKDESRILVERKIEYFDTISLNGTSRVLINGDTLYPELLRYYYYWDNDSNKFYHDVSDWLMVISNGRTHINGEFWSNNKSSQFNYYLPLDNYEYEFFQMIELIVGKYQKHFDLTSFEEDTADIGPDK